MSWAKKQLIVCGSLFINLWVKAAFMCAHACIQIHFPSSKAVSPEQKISCFHTSTGVILQICDWCKLSSWPLKNSSIMLVLTYACFPGKNHEVDEIKVRYSKIASWAETTKNVYCFIHPTKLAGKEPGRRSSNRGAARLLFLVGPMPVTWDVFKLLGTWHVNSWACYGRDA